VSKAFYRVWHDGLLFKLQQIGISGSLLSWMKSYLSNRSQKVVICGKTSESLPIKAGVPQGSILGPLLFLIYVNDIVDTIETYINLFADDTSLLESISDANSSFANINRDLHIHLCT
jgi:hypothetical protein